MAENSEVAVPKKWIISALDAGYHPVSLLYKCIWPGTYVYLLKVYRDPGELHMERMNMKFHFGGIYCESP